MILGGPPIGRSCLSVNISLNHTVLPVTFVCMQHRVDAYLLLAINNTVITKYNFQ